MNIQCLYCHFDIFINQFYIETKLFRIFRCSVCRKIEQPLESRRDPDISVDARALTGREETRHVYYPPINTYQQPAPPRNRQRIRNQTSARRPYNYPSNPQYSG